MRLRDLVIPLTETDTNIPDSVRHTLPKTVLFPDMNNQYEFYKFVVAMATHPEIDSTVTLNHRLRDVPIAVAYSDAEYDMITSVAKRLGKRYEEIAYNGSEELPGTGTTSPVMKFHMSEAHIDIMRSLFDAINESSNNDTK